MKNETATTNQTRVEKCREINANGYTHEGMPPVPSCPKCGGWTAFGGMSQHRSNTTRVRGRLGCEVACRIHIHPVEEKYLKETFDFFDKMNKYNNDKAANFIDA